MLPESKISPSGRNDTPEKSGWIPPFGDKRPEAVTRQTEPVGYAAPTHHTGLNALIEQLNKSLAA